MLNVPNLLTLVRFLLVPVYLFIFFSDIPSPARLCWAIGIIFLAGLTDVVDGYLARRNNQVTQMGAMLDPLADKCMLMAIFLSLLLSDKISWEAAFAILFRDLGMIVYGAIVHFQGRKTVPANFLGKLTTVLSYLVLFMVMFDVPYASTILWIVIGLSYIATLSYMFQLKVVNE
ncbi:CDP-diacylglycerol--glycerol-3-phosphate 3-phosphatidyltransferase [Thermoactinomyces sp. DSM 45891]|uniref:CDP-alcohol phosphatidyltransferase family protein n=1 Tax=Thermoactinomyces sp. DSM 45891 TaxID=1761907 RepID=UPI000923D5FC|nr:CDP-alcohol phosphatidyltransferase family protein [Thermoactinomyces sp. DSM 45891]SFX23746.1 CDP-diacylglycerol--glycerol-3-phosphate 3-phosphatidyltransferase [Thermoactinomyces sp. DSM 45891]